MVAPEPDYQTGRIVIFDQSSIVNRYTFTVSNTQRLGEGVSMSANGSIFAVSDSNYQSNAGIVYIFKNVDSNGNGVFDSKTQLGQTIIGDNAGDRIGGKKQIALSGKGFADSYWRIYRKICQGLRSGKLLREGADWGRHNRIRYNS